MIVIRDYRPDADKNFVMATFLRGVYYGDTWFSLIPKNIFMNAYKKFAEAIVNNPKTIIKVACLQDDPDVMVGYSILSSDFSAITWVFVKAAWRKQGIARQLLPQLPTTVTHLTPLGKSLLPKFKTQVIFNPFYVQE